MQKNSRFPLIVAFAVIPAFAFAADTALKKYDTPQAVVDAHVNALNHCDLEGLMSQYPENAQFHLPNGVVLNGPTEIRSLFENFCKPSTEGGLAGLQIIPESTFVVDGTVNVMWRAEAPFLAKPYKGSDAYVTQNGLMAAQVTTFLGSALEMKK